MAEPERSVWRAVLTQAYQDAEMAPLCDEIGADPIECTKARRFLRADSPFEAASLAFVCEFADLFVSLRICPRTASFPGRGGATRSRLEGTT